MSRTPDVVVVGAGPAGLAAAASAAERGAGVLILDDNRAPGGQIWRQTPGKCPASLPGHSFAALDKFGVETRFGSTVVDAPGPGHLIVMTDEGRLNVQYGKLILATGARELFLPFPGWTLPGVFGVGGLQALLKNGVDFANKRIVIAGSGPLLLAVGAAFAEANAEVVGVYEQAPWKQLANFGFQAMVRYRKFGDAIKYRRALGSASYEIGAWVSEADGLDRIENVTLTDGRRSWTEACDFLACSYGLVPNLELAELLGCAIEDGRVVVNQHQETSVPNVYAVGEIVGVGGLELGMKEGELAGEGVMGTPEGSALARVSAQRPFREALAKGFALRPEVLNLAKPDTIVCRCEDVRLAELQGMTGRREAKLCTRLGMGPCQGRICGAATQAMFGWERDRARPPLYPTEVRILTTHKGDTD